MIGEKFTVNSTEYKIQNLMTMGEFEDLSNLQSKISELSKDIPQADDVEELSAEQLAKQTEALVSLAESNSEHIQLMTNFLDRVVGLKHEDLRKLTLPDAMQVFSQAFTLSSSVKKN